jgi:hypothetical protein
MAFTRTLNDTVLPNVTKKNFRLRSKDGNSQSTIGQKVGLIEIGPARCLLPPIANPVRHSLYLRAAALYARRSGGGDRRHRDPKSLETTRRPD